MGNCVNMDRSPSHVLESADFADLLPTWTDYYYTYEDTTLADSALPAPCYSTFCSSVGGIIPAFLVVASTLGILCSLALAIALATCFRLREQIGLILTALLTTLYAAILPFFAAGISWGWVYGDGLCRAASATKNGCLFAQGLLMAACVCPMPKALPGCLLFLALWVTGFLLAIPVAVIHSTGKDGEAICALSQEPELLWWSLTHVIFWLAVFDILPVGIALAKVALKWQRDGWHLPVVIPWLFYLLWAPYGVALMLDTLLQMNLLTHTCSLQEHLSYFLGLSEGLGVLHCFLCPFLLLGMVIRHRRAAQ